MQSPILRARLVQASFIAVAVLSGCSTNSGQSTSTEAATSFTATAPSPTATAPGSDTIQSSNPTQSPDTTQSASATAQASTASKGGNAVTTSLSGPSPSSPAPMQSAGIVAFSTASVSTQRVSGAALLTVARQVGSSGAITVNYSTSDGTAVQGTNYESAQGTLTWEDGDDQPKTIAINIQQSEPFTGTKQFAITLSNPSAHAALGSPSVSSVVIVGTLTTKSISEWVKCDGTDDSEGTRAAMNAAKNNAFVLVIDCPIRIHFSGQMAKSIVIEDGTTVEFQGDGAVIIDSVSPPPLQVTNPSNVTLVNWNVNYPGA